MAPLHRHWRGHTQQFQTVAYHGLCREREIEPNEILHIGSRLTQDIAPAKRLGMRTALFAGDKASLGATPEQLKDPKSRPDVLLTELSQILDVVKPEE